MKERMEFRVEEDTLGEYLVYRNSRKVEYQIYRVLRSRERAE